MQSNSFMLKLLYVVIVTLTISNFANAQNADSKMKIEYGVFVQGGFPPAYISKFSTGTETISTPLNLQFYESGIYGGISLPHYNGIKQLSGRGEALVEIIPAWFAYYPQQSTITTINAPGGKITQQVQFNASTFFGSSITPLLFRWNFSENDDQRIQPWIQVGSGIIWTNHKFPINYDRDTSIFNFTPQVGAGVNIFRSSKHSVSLGMKFIHISNGGLGDYNPAIHDSLNFSVGYSWWK